MRSLLIRWFIDGVSLWVAIQVVPGIQATDDINKLAIVIALFCMVNFIFRPLLWLLTCPLILVTVIPSMLGLNAFIIWLSAWIAGYLGLSFTVRGFVPSLLGAIVVSIVRLIATRFVQNQKRKQAFRREQALIGQLERHKAWLEEQRNNWQRLAKDRERIIQEQLTSIGFLKQGKKWLKERLSIKQPFMEEFQDQLKKPQV